MPEWLTSVVAGVGSGLLGGGIAYGSLVTRVQHLEKDMEKAVSRELFDAHIKAITDKLDRILDKLEGNTNPGR